MNKMTIKLLANEAQRLQGRCSLIRVLEKNPQTEKTIRQLIEGMYQCLDRMLDILDGRIKK